MIAQTTRVGFFRGTDIAFEYEIRDDLGNVLARDYHHFKLLPGEGKAAALSLHRDFLRRRCAKWALSDTSEKKARRRESRLGSALPDNLGRLPFNLRRTEYPAVSMGPTEALALQVVLTYDFTNLTNAQRTQLEAAEASGDMTLFESLAAQWGTRAYVEAFRV